MKYNPDIHHRRSIRLKGYDYSKVGAYFLTICAHERQCLFGEIVDGETRPNEYGRIVSEEWFRSAELRPEIEMREFVVMPNHFHGIVIIGDETSCRGTARRAPTAVPFSTAEQFGRPVAGSLPTIARAFKSAVTKRINIHRDTPGAPVWQRNYYEHVIRDDADYIRIAEYVADNPRRWREDSLHPGNCTGGDAGGNVINAGGKSDARGGNEMDNANHGCVGNNDRGATDTGNINHIDDGNAVGARRAVPLRTSNPGGDDE